MSELQKLLKSSGYSSKGIMLYEKKTGVGEIKKADAYYMYTGPCGDTIEFFLGIKDSIITDAKFRAIGCAASFMAGSAVTEMIKGKTVEYAIKLTEEDIIDFLNGLPPQKVHCVCLAKTTLVKALTKYKEK